MQLYNNSLEWEYERSPFAFWDTIWWLFVLEETDTYLQAGK